MTDWQTAKARAAKAVADRVTVSGLFSDESHDDNCEHCKTRRAVYYDQIAVTLNALRDSGYAVVRASDPSVKARDAGFQAHANGGAKAFGASYEAMVAEMAKETAS